MKKKVFSIFLTLALSLSMGVTSFASSNDLSSDSDVCKSFSINEYDVVTELRSNSDQDLEEKGYSEDEIKEIRSDEYEQDLLKRSQLSDSELKSEFNYNEEQIEVLKNYEGEPIQEVPEMRAVAATCNGTVSCPTASSEFIYIKLNWKWTTAPSFRTVDAAAVRWKGTDTGGNPLNVALNNNASNSYCTVNYVYFAGEKPSTSVKKALTVTDSYGKAYSDFAMTKISNGDINQWAKSGELQIKVDKTGTKPIKEVAVCFSYGHSTVSASGVSVSWPAGFSISFSSGVTTMFTEPRRVSNTGSITSY
ncbi:pre-mRNA-splicing factor CWC21 [Aminipila terrae]|uniref:Ig-like domain-containing protein n=1 Tax=Aminipila terrae TaxID=2697030 RepID=A0A6P1MEL0_9FIRM|nr:hypothetical protein [Aminipila terrae]QHI73090.1 hypothetical protein Ami3637_12375 [Aminipila terrae]